MARKSNRREFLTGQSAIDAIDDLTLGDANVPTPAAAKPPAQQESLLLHVGREAMACQFEVLLNQGQYSTGPEAALETLERIDELEAQLTIYRERSEVMHINKTAATRPVPVESSLFQLLLRSADLSKQTGGAFDITSGPLSKIWGFYRRQGQMPSPEEIATALQCVGRQHLEFQPTDETIRFLREGVELNLGAIGKGYALDQAAVRLLEGGVSDFCFHGGMSSVLARGTRRRQGQTGWQVAWRNPLRPEQRLAIFHLHEQALGTSGSGTQYFHHQGKRYGHILDPRTGWPADRSLSATVLAPTAEQADSLATALYVMGLEEARTFLTGRSDLAVLLALAGRRAGTLTLHTWNLSERNWELLPPTHSDQVNVVVEASEG